MSKELLGLITNSVIIGVGATVIMDIWALILQRFFGVAPLNYALLGRWLAYTRTSHFRHKNITAAKPIAGEMTVGWAAHYLIGIIFAGVFIMLTGNDWLNNPSVIDTIIFGILTVFFPFFIMQPCMGFGIAAAKNPKPNLARFRTLLTHFVFGLGLYLSATVKILF